MGKLHPIPADFGRDLWWHPGKVTNLSQGYCWIIHAQKLDGILGEMTKNKNILQIWNNLFLFHSSVWHVLSSSWKSGGRWLSVGAQGKGDLRKMLRKDKRYHLNWLQLFFGMGITWWKEMIQSINNLCIVVMMWAECMQSLFAIIVRTLSLFSRSVVPLRTWSLFWTLIKEAYTNLLGLNQHMIIFVTSK